MLNSWFFDPEFERVEGNYGPEKKFTRFHCQNLAGLKERVKINRYPKKWDLILITVTLVRFLKVKNTPKLKKRMYEHLRGIEAERTSMPVQR